MKKSLLNKKDFFLIKKGLSSLLKEVEVKMCDIISLQINSSKDTCDKLEQDYLKYEQEWTAIRQLLEKLF